MMTRHLLLLGMACLAVYTLHAQSGQPDTLHIDQVEVSSLRPRGTSRSEQYSGQQHISISGAQLQALSGSTLSTLLGQQSPVQVRQAGWGQSASVSVRGTSSAHTAIQWNGLPITPLTMGQVDLNLLPLFFVDQASLQLGGESALYGTGSIGGNISLSNHPTPLLGTHLLVQQGVASYSRYTTGIKLQHGSAHWGSSSALLGSKATNNFEFRNTARYGAPIEQVRNAGYQSYGAMQNVYWRPSAQQQLSVNAWYLYHHKAIQPSMSNNLQAQSYDSISNQGLRLSVAHEGNWGSTATLLQGGYVYDKQLYQQDRITTHNLMLIAEGQHTVWDKRIRLKAGINPQRIAPEVHSYAHGIVEWRTDVYAMTKANPTPYWLLTASVRQSYVTGIKATPTYSASILYQGLQWQHHAIDLRVGGARSLRVPSLNDRYWGHTINDYLRPERAYNMEGGWVYHYLSSRMNIEASTTVYHNRVRDWIRWIPLGTVWKPMNIAQVHATGTELGLQTQLRLGKLEANLVVRYAYTRAIVIQGSHPDDALVGRQLPYTPLHGANASLGATWQGWLLRLHMHHTGQSTTTDRYVTLPAYTLLDIEASKQLQLGRHSLTLQLMINNVMNTEYQSVKYFAMPGRNWELMAIWKM